MQTEIQKGKGIEGLVGYTPKVEEARQINASQHGLSELYERYVQIIDVDFNVALDQLKTITDILTPDQINAFLQQTILYENRPDYPDNTGSFISRLIQNSYNSGKNNFTLNTTELKKVGHLGYGIEGTPKKPLEIAIIGNTGQSCGVWSGDAIINIQGNTGDRCGSFSTNSTYTITGNIGKGCGFDSKKSTYKTSNEETLQTMLRDVPHGNRIIFINPDGTEDIIRECNDER